MAMASLIFERHFGFQQNDPGLDDHSNQGLRTIMNLSLDCWYHQ
jgi:hypothetical protein